MRKYSHVFTYSRGTCFTRQSPQALANSFMGGMAAGEYRLLTTFLQMSGNWEAR